MTASAMTMAELAELEARRGEIGPLTYDETAALREIKMERRRQILDERFTLEHDEQHRDGELLLAASAYLTSAVLGTTSGGMTSHLAHAFWPWSMEWWKPGTPRRCLTKAGALAMAHLDQHLGEPTSAHTAVAWKIVSMAIRGITRSMYEPEQQPCPGHGPVEDEFPQATTGPEEAA